MDAKVEYEKEMKRRNFTRAVTVAEEGSLGEDVAAKAKRLAIRQAVGEWFNFRGAGSLARELGVSTQEVREICDELIAEFNEREERETRVYKVFDIDRMDHTPVVKLIAGFRDSFKG